MRFRTLLLYIILFLHLLPLAAQDTDATQWKNQLKKPLSDSVRISILLKLGDAMQDSMPDDAFQYVHQAYLLASKHENSHQEARALRMLGRLYEKSGRMDTALTVLKNGYAEAQEEGDSLQMARISIEIGIVYKSLGKMDKSLLEEQKALNLLKDLGDSANAALALNVLGNVYVDQGSYSMGLDVYQHALKINKALKNRALVSANLNNIGRIYGYKKEYNKALDYFKRSLSILEDIGKTSDENTQYNNIGYILKQMGEYEKALPYLFKSLSLIKTLDKPCADFYPLYNIGSIYVQQDMLDSACYYLQLARDESAQCSNWYIWVLAHYDLGKAYEKLGQKEKALKSYKLAYGKATAVGLKAELEETALALSELYESKGNTTAALHYYKVFHTTKDSLFNAENTKKIARMEAEFEFARQQQQDDMQHRVQELKQQQELAKAVRIRNGLLLGLLVLTIITYLIYRNYKRKQRANEQLNKLYAEIQEQKEELEVQSDELKAANEEISRINENLESIVAERTQTVRKQKEKILEYVSYNSHQVRGPIARILGLIGLFDTRAVSEEEIERILKDIDKATKELDAMVKKMTRTLEEERKN